MSVDPKQLFKSVLISNRKRLGLKTKKNKKSSLAEKLETYKNKSDLNLSELFSELDLASSSTSKPGDNINSNFDITNTSLSSSEEEEEQIETFCSTNLTKSNKMDVLRSFATILPTFSGNPEHLESFIFSIDEFHSLYYNGEEIQKKFVFSVIRSKLVENSKDFIMSRPDLKTWTDIKVALREKYGDPIGYQTLMQQLNYINKNKHEDLLDFVQRLKLFVQRINSKIQSENIDNNSKLILTSQADKTAVIVLMSNVPESLKTILLIHNPSNLDAALVQVTNYNLIESQINLKNQVTPKPFHQQRKSTNFNQSFNQNSQSFNQNPQQFQQQNNFKQTFPSQPVQVQSRPIKQHFPTNAQVFGKPKNVFAPQKNMNQRLSPKPTPMSVQSAGPSRINQPQQNRQYYNYFQPTGPKNFVSQELTNLQTNHEHAEDQNSEEYYDDYYYNDEDIPNVQEEDISLSPHQESPNTENQNFHEIASTDPLT